ncbi:cyanophycinase [Hymenobacter taeanensis]|uniref:Cyanophycinase n=1 Tax=Hymenobacter taeanensis TaxID=2735321 RepID=A0A6M6BDL0_9BACT|nr:MULTISPECIES: cyanophycinase [Hymenobacter]QJX46079.1 cyanophycinase [Hymenobacter taeanensis]UOQ79933.1 cyanophycinase [Hymenobacter sp. 5414T-23]
MPASSKKSVAKAGGQASCPHPQGILIPIGGHERKEQLPESETSEIPDIAPALILQRVVDELDGKGPIVVIPTASEDAEQAGEEYVEIFRKLGASRVEVLNIQTRQQANDEELVKVLQKARGVMFTGGDQLRLTALLGGTLLQQVIKQRYTHDQFLIAGTSAGATAMSTPMIYQGRNDAGMLKDEIHITTGLEFLHNVAIDTHFVARGRIVRMAQIIATNPACIGLGLEENTGVVITKGCELEVIGDGIVIIVDGMQCSSTNIHEIAPGTPFTMRDLRVHMLARGERYTLPILEQMHT